MTTAEVKPNSAIESASAGDIGVTTNSISPSSDRPPQYSINEFSSLAARQD